MISVLKQCSVDHFNKIQYDKGLKQHYIGSFQQIKG